MTDLMLEGVLRMPIEMAMETDLSRVQFYDRAQQAMDEIERLQKLEAEVKASAGLKCPTCDDSGGYPVHGPNPDPYYGGTTPEVLQEQCEFCWTVPDSVFRRREALRDE